MHGRGYEFGGDRASALFLKEEFKKLDLRTFKGDYFQYFTLDINTFSGRMRLRVNKRKLQTGKDFIINPISLPGQGKGRLLHLDTSIYQNGDSQAKFLKKRLKKKILVYQATDFPKIAAMPQKAIDKIYSSKALIELKDTKLVSSLSSRQLAPPIFEMLKSDYDSIISLSREKKKKFRARFAVDAEVINHYPSQNVVGYIEGSVEPDSFIVVSAHYDHLGHLGKKVYFPGANDNASGISMLLELAHYYADPKNRPPYSIAFIAFGGEEAGLIGSKFYVLHPLFPLEKIKFLFNLDLVGTGDEGATVVNGSIFKPEFQILNQINEEKKYLPKINVRGIAANSDHYYFSENGVRAFFLYTMGGIKAYHDIYDKAETLPLTKYKELFHLLIDFFDQLQKKPVKGGG